MEKSQSKQKSLSEKLDKILERLETESYLCSEENHDEYKNCRKKAHKAILDLIKGLVPDRHADSFSEGAWEPEWAQGFNACGEEMLRRLS